MLKNDFVKYAHDGWQGMIVDGWQDTFSNLPVWLATPQSVVLEAPCRRVARHKTEQGTLYSKLMWARNDGAIQKREWLSWIKWAFGPSRSLHIWNVSYAMIAKGHPCAVPVLALRKRCRNGRHLNLLVTQEIEAPTIEQIILSGKHEDAESAVKYGGVCLARLHKDNFLHGDYLPRNACLKNGEVIFLDNDKSSNWPFRPPLFLRRRNLEQFAYNLLILSGMKSCDDTLSMIFLNAYCDEAGISQREGLLASVMKKCRKRWQSRARRSVSAEQSVK